MNIEEEWKNLTPDERGYGLLAFSESGEDPCTNDYFKEWIIHLINNGKNSMWPKNQKCSCCLKKLPTYAGRSQGPEPKDKRKKRLILCQKCSYSPEGKQKFSDLCNNN